jgi:nucleotide-binding universal stress UspA family protein
MYSRILLPLDGSEVAQGVVPHALDIARCYDAELLLLSVVDSFEKIMVETASASGAVTPPPSMAEVTVDTARQIAESQANAARSYLATVAEGLRASGAKVRTAVVEGTSAERILAFAQREDCDLIAIATHGRSGLTRTILGSVADEVMRTSRLPVLMIHPQG